MTKRDDIVQSWRQDHKDELDRTLAVLISIRDDTNEKSKDRIDAGRSIARMLGSMAPEKEEARPQAKDVTKTIAERGLEELLAGIQ